MCSRYFGRHLPVTLLGIPQNPVCWWPLAPVGVPHDLGRAPACLVLYNEDKILLWKITVCICIISVSAQRTSVSIDNSTVCRGRLLDTVFSLSPQQPIQKMMVYPEPKLTENISSAVPPPNQKDWKHWLCIVIRNDLHALRIQKNTGHNPSSQPVRFLSRPLHA